MSTAGQHRRSHNKSKNGCNHCRQRHIRCDESLPECNNCKGRHRCDYLDGAPLALLGHRGSRMLLPLLEGAGARDDSTRVSKNDSQSATAIPLGLPLTPRCPEEQQLLHYFARDLMRSNTSRLSRFTSSIAFMPRFLIIAETFDFVRDAALAVSALYFSGAQGRPEYRTIAQKHQSRAVRGIRESLPNFSQQNADALLASSILLSWQAVDENSFASFTCGTASVIESIQMHPWKRTSFLHDVALSTFALASNLSVHQGIAVPRPPEERSESKMFDLMRGPLEELSSRLQCYSDAKCSINCLLKVCNALQDPSARTDLKFRFSLINPGMWQLVWLPTLLNGNSGDKWILVLMAYFHAMIMSLEPIRYAPVSQLTRSSCLSPVYSILDELQKLPDGEERTLILELMVLPGTIANDMQDQLKQHRDALDFAGLLRDGESR